MKIKFNGNHFSIGKRFTLNIMKAFVLLYATVIFGFAPKDMLSQNPNIYIESQSSFTVEQVFELIMQQTDYKFIYQESVFDDFPKVKVDKGVITANDLLEKSLSSGHFEISLGTNNTVIVKKKLEQQKKQQFSVSGQVLDESNFPIVGVNVIEKGTDNGVITDLEGYYSISVSSVNAVLIFSHISHQSLEVNVSSNEDINIQLKEMQSHLDEVVITGRAGASDRTKLNTSYSVTTIKEKALLLQAPTSVTETLKSVPGFWVEASGGEASGNVRARGVPVDGYGSIQLLEDGIPVQHDPALGYLNADQAFRFDETIQTIEVVRGGPSSVFYSNAPAGAVNYIPRVIGDKAEGIFKMTMGSGDLYRGDFWVGTPIGNDWKMAVGGFYRSSTGVRDPGYTGNLGGQVRISLSREWEKSSFNFDVKNMDDSVIFYAGIPMTFDSDGDIVAVDGFNGHTGTISGPETQLSEMIQSDGSTYKFDNSLGTNVKRTQLTAKFKTDLGANWILNNTSRYNDSRTIRNGVYPNSLTTATDFLSSSSISSLLEGVPGATGFQMHYVTSNEVFDEQNQNGNGLVMQGGLRGITMPLKEFMSDTRIARTFKTGSSTHDFNIGYYYAHTEEDFSRYSSVALLDVQNNSRLLNLVAVDAAGNAIQTITDNGILRYGYEWENAHGEQNTHAIYISDEWQITPEFRLDGGLRWETMNTRGVVEQKGENVNLGTIPTSNIINGNGIFKNYDDTFSHTTWTLGADYQFSDNMGAFARFTSAARLPGLGNYVTNAGATPDVQTMNLGEIGFKYNTSKIGLYATGFWTKYDNIAFTNYVFDINSNEQTTENLYADTKTLGLELELGYYPLNWFDITGTATLQNGQYKGLTFSDSEGTVNDYDGNSLIRVPATTFRLVPGFNLFSNILRVQTAFEFVGDRYVDTANSVKLPSYTKIDFSLSTKINQRVSVFAYIDNLNNSLGLTEGNPRQGEVQNAAAGSDIFIARPLIGRNFRVALRYSF
ncbi:TonB-dependent receptor [Formosa agariphila KMM 3901]|uniref:TonB-dependent receptor n=1 Tax=Formosa agariphila (strain DSM 15362 / KCTC 12365 / LMG 23005 / KMM 3901 / M-2Alg 35-1) TaxID=1347342 RepID=T2KQR8_FORAG|nr:TonB-dependent receptor [Formosa agariphila]CDF80314.1 TonB-dependent receptor [Formosa agariphila KMM 3901]